MARHLKLDGIPAEQMKLLKRGHVPPKVASLYRLMLYEIHTNNNLEWTSNMLGYADARNESYRFVITAMEMRWPCLEVHGAWFQENLEKVGA